MYYQGLGRRKTSSARVRLHPDGSGQFVVNGKSYREFDVMQPLEATQTAGQFDVTVLVKGGGISGQAGAIKMGVARALLQVNPDFRPVLRTGGMLTRDSRMKERKKPGLKRARKATQYTKR